MQISDQLLKRIGNEHGSANRHVTLSVPRECIAVLEKYRKYETTDGGRSKRQSLGEVAGELILAADELLKKHASETASRSHGEAEKKNA